VTWRAKVEEPAQGRVKSARGCPLGSPRVRQVEGGSASVVHGDASAPVAMDELLARRIADVRP
jgi:hypothetical protein